MTGVCATLFSFQSWLVFGSFLDLEILSSKMKKDNVFAPQIMHDRDGANAIYSKEQLRSIGSRYYATCVPPCWSNLGLKAPLCHAAGHRSGTSLLFPHIVQANPTSSSLDSLRDSFGGG